MDERLAPVRLLLERHGLATSVSVAGTEGEIVAVGAPPEQRPQLADLAPAIRALGFRYVAIDLDVGMSVNPGNT
jgi:hypothetical protein